ncbi:MAG: zinc ribbon domain-containing protein [Acidobacteria bacterium]|nr:zinc ribbon domain-containing protein [Acidobacteriota bacterium]
MPLYEYRCRACGHRFEELQRLGESAEKVTCPECGERQAERQLSTFAAAAASGSLGSFSSGGRGGCGSGFT